MFKEGISCYSDLEERLTVFSENFGYEDPSVIKTEEGQQVLSICLDSLHQMEYLDEVQIDSLMETLKKETNQKGKALFFPLRMAFTGMLHGPELKKVMLLLTKKGCEERLERALQG